MKRAPGAATFLVGLHQQMITARELALSQRALIPPAYEHGLSSTVNTNTMILHIPLTFIIRTNLLYAHRIYVRS